LTKRGSGAFRAPGISEGETGRGAGAAFFFSFLSIARATAAATPFFGAVAARLECHTRPGSAAISSSVRPVSTLSGRSFVASYSDAGRANSSRSLKRSQLLSESRGSRPFVLTSIQAPWSFSPYRRNFRRPFAYAWWGSSIGSQRPRSQSTTVPPPYSPAGMMPSKSPYSSGWSSVCMASRLSAGS
jgi:hypothetical protein